MVARNSQERHHLHSSGLDWSTAVLAWWCHTNLVPSDSNKQVMFGEGLWWGVGSSFITTCEELRQKQKLLG